MRFLDAMTSLLATLRLKKYSAATLDNYGDQLKRFGEWLESQRLFDLRVLTREHVRSYELHVRKEPIGRETQALRLRAKIKHVTSALQSGLNDLI